MPTVITSREMADGAMLKASLVNGQRPRTCQTKPEVAHVVGPRIREYARRYAAGESVTRGEPLEFIPPPAPSEAVAAPGSEPLATGAGDFYFGPLDEPPDDDDQDDDDSNSPES